MGMRVYIGTTSGAETLQGSSIGTASYVQSGPLVSGTALPTTNNTICKIVANDAMYPLGTGYTVALTNTAGNSLPGYPMQWQLMGPGTTVNVSSGIPYYNGVVMFPSPVLASPLNQRSAVNCLLDLPSKRRGDGQRGEAVCQLNNRSHVRKCCHKHGVL
jgi:hypothetical protein